MSLQWRRILHPLHCRRKRRCIQPAFLPPPWRNRSRPRLRLQSRSSPHLWMDSFSESPPRRQPLPQLSRFLQKHLPLLPSHLPQLLPSRLPPLLPSLLLSHLLQLLPSLLSCLLQLLPSLLLSHLLQLPQSLLLPSLLLSRLLRPLLPLSHCLRRKTPLHCCFPALSHPQRPFFRLSQMPPAAEGSPRYPPFVPSSPLGSLPSDTASACTTVSILSRRSFTNESGGDVILASFLTLFS